MPLILSDNVSVRQFFKPLVFCAALPAAAALASCTMGSPSLPQAGRASIGIPGDIPLQPPPAEQKPGQQQQRPKTDPFSISADPGAASYREEIYPFDLTLDTIAYMNCPSKQAPHPFDATVLFSFKFGSYYEGLKLSDIFLDSLGERPTVEEVQRALKTSTLTRSKAQVYLSFKGEPERPQLFVESGDNFYGFFVTPFDHTEIISNLINRGKSLVLGGNRLIETQFQASGRDISRVTPLLGKSHVFALTYSRGGANSSPKGRFIKKKTNVYYGQTYDIFLRGGYNHNDYMAHVDETDLLTLRNAGRWHCPESLRFVIHRHDRTIANNYDGSEQYFYENKLSQEGACMANPRVLPARHKDLVERILLNRVFTVGESTFWDINGRLHKTGERCIVPKDIAHDYCYEVENLLRVEFDPDEECQLRAEKTDKRCPSYFSVCVRDRRL